MGILVQGDLNLEGGVIVITPTGVVVDGEEYLLINATGSIQGNATISVVPTVEQATCEEVSAREVRSSNTLSVIWAVDSSNCGGGGDKSGLTSDSPGFFVLVTVLPLVSVCCCCLVVVVVISIAAIVVRRPTKAGEVRRIRNASLFDASTCGDDPSVLGH